MKQILSFLLFMIVMKTFSQTNFWEKPEVVEEGKEPARAWFIPYRSVQNLLLNDICQSENIQFLNGTWKFHFVEKVADRPLDFFSEDLNDTDWKDIQVPGSWEVQGFGVPVYTNINYIFPENPPFVDNNDLPIGTYRTRFILDKKMEGKNIILHFGSIAGAATVYLNGQRLGYSKVSKTPAEFNITSFLKPGENLLAIQVFKWSDASYLEDQDFWRLAGIERDVLLIARPDLSIEDFFIIGDLDANYENGLFKMETDLRNFATQNSEEHSLFVSLYDPQMKIIFSKTFEVVPLMARSEKNLSYTQKINHPEKWSAEFPNLYFVTMELKNTNGETIEAAGCYTGFRKMEIRNKQLLINGKPIIIRGTNLHEHHEKYGHYVDFATKLKDIQLMKQNNLNAIRTSHYPQSPEFYDLCDKYGIYVVDEANIEAHGLDGMPADQHPSNREDWKGQHLDRTIRMFERDKNHPSVIVWSLGNESDFGTNYEVTYKWLKDNDKAGRPVQSERANGNGFTDLMTPMYSSPETSEKYANDSTSEEPFILCEYAHSMGNSTGNLQEYWDIFMNYPILQGGFIWDWVDQGLEAYNFEGKKYWIYGGDKGGYRWTHDENFCNNGLVNADRSIHPALNEVKKVYQPVWFKTSDIEKGLIKVCNYNLFTNLSAYQFTWKLFENGHQIDSKNFKLKGKPLEEKEVRLQIPDIDYKPGNEFFLIVEARQTIATELIEKGHVVASEQFAFPQNKFFIQNIPTGDLKITERDDTLTFENGKIQGSLDLKTGEILDYTYNGTKLITKALKPNFWRAPTDNDFGNEMPFRLNIWRTADYNMIVDTVKVNDQDEIGVKVCVDYSFFRSDVKYTVTYTIRNDASIVVTSDLDLGECDLPELPRFGMKMQLPVEFENIAYYGRGPWENYSDRNTSSFIGRYKSKVADLGFDYSRPQENGYRTDVREVSFTDSTGFGIRIEGVNGPICFNARNNLDEDLDPGLTKKQQHPIDVYKRDKLYVNIDYKQMGVGGNNSWGAFPLDKYRLKEKKYEYSFLIQLVRP